MRRNWFTLIELLVVLAIIVLVSAAVLPAVLPALQHRQVSESARLLQATIEGTRDAAIRANAPRGVRLMVDPAFPGSTTDPTVPLAYARLMPIEPAPDYTDGLVSVRGLSSDAPNMAGGRALRIEEARVDAVGFPNSPTSWSWNVRVGDRIAIGEAAVAGGRGQVYTIVGPVIDANPERFVNVGPPGTTPTNPQEAGAEYLFLVNGRDDDGDGWTDEGFDGVDNDLDGTVDEVDEWEVEAWTGPQQYAGVTRQPYRILRRPVPTQGGRVVELPSGVVIDATTWSSTRERSRLPIDPFDLSCEIMVQPNGTVVPTTLYSSPSSADVVPFLHCWLVERSDVVAPAAAGARRLPIPEGESRRLMTVNTRSGNVVTNAIETFDPNDVNVPFYAAQAGVRDTP